MQLLVSLNEPHELFSVPVVLNLSREKLRERNQTPESLFLLLVSFTLLNLKMSPCFCLPVIYVTNGGELDVWSSG